MSKELYSEKAISWISKKPQISIRAQLEGYEPTQVFANKSTGKEVQSDFSFQSHGGSTSFVEIALKTDNPRELITKWKLLSLMASMKHGKLYLLAPKGHKMFAQRLIEDYNISARLESL